MENDTSFDSWVYAYSQLEGRVRQKNVPYKSYVPKIQISSALREELRKYQCRYSWLPGLVADRILDYPFPFDSGEEVAYCSEEEHPPIPTEILVHEANEQINARRLDLDVKYHRFRSAAFPKELVMKSDDYMRKNYHCNEVNTLRFIREFTSIPVPKVVQISQGGPTSGDTLFRVNEFIPGRTLHECWDTLGWTKKLRIAWTLRSYVAQLRSLRRTYPGPLDRRLKCEGYYFPLDGAGPFELYQSMTAWFNRRIEVGQLADAVSYDLTPFEAEEGPLLFVHQDLGLRNLLLGDDDVLYIIDWEWAGFYPEWLEYAGVAKYEDLPWSFNILISFIFGFGHLKNFQRLGAAAWGTNLGKRIE